MEKEYKPLIIPKLSCNKDNVTDMFGEFVAQPLESGFGMTIGNALRRVLLGGIEGSAVTSVIIRGVNNEFSSIPGVVEDTMSLVLNIKDIVLKNTTGKSGKMHLKVKGPKKVVAGDITPDSHLKIINKDLVLANVSDNGELDITFFVETGRGYQKAQWPVDKMYQEDGAIFIDAMFSPVVKVMFDIEKTRVGGDIDFDKLIIRVNTNGSETPHDVLHYAVSVLRTQLEHFLSTEEIPFNKIASSVQKEAEAETSQIKKSTEGKFIGIPIDLLLKPIDELELSVRSHNCLLQADIKRVLDLVQIKEDDLLKIKNFGRKSLNEVKDSVKAFGLSFGMDIDEEEINNLLKQS